jgi:hypothetical protein
MYRESFRCLRRGTIIIIIMEHLAKLSNEVVHFSLGLLQLAQFLVCGLGQWPQVLVMVLDHSLKVTVEFSEEV